MSHTMNLPPRSTIILAVPDMTWASTWARVEAGTLPAIAAVAQRGVRCRMTPLVDPNAPAIWPTIATGQLAERHAILAAAEAWAGGMRPPQRSSWRAPPFWEQLTRAGIATLGVGWPVTEPGSDWAATIIDNRIGQPTGAGWDDWFLPRGVSPAGLRDRVRDMRVHPTDITAEMLRPFVPDLESVDQHRDRRLIDLALAIAQFTTVFGVARELLRDGTWPVVTLYTDFLAILHRHFDRAEAPFDRVIDAGWTTIDTLVAALSAMMPPDATVILISPGRSGLAGIVMAAGPGLSADVELASLRAIDVAPSVIARHGLIDTALPGRSRRTTTSSITPAI